AGTGDAGLDDARACCQAVADTLGLQPQQVLPFSTGVIGERLPLAAVQQALVGVNTRLCEHNWLAAAKAIMTTDTVPKAVTRSITVSAEDGSTRQITLTGIAKGSGMIRPDMATMLAFVATDAFIAQPDLDTAVRVAVERSFNCISVDGDTSTNDACVVSATGSRVHLSPDHDHWSALTAALTDLLRELAQAIVRDAEGATRFITLAVTGADSDQ